ncbi:MAG: tRNA pseudouridine38-40 synthase [Paraglaciecola sp.]|jgi:tRNA pseudouridine38-40 synthase
MKYFLHLAYKGTNYSGWQRQINTPNTIQQTLEETISKMVGASTTCIGCGRTDAGVHASQFYAHIVIEKGFDYDPVERLNRMLPNDISIFECLPVDYPNHAQYDATSRTYKYHIHGQKNAFLSELSAYYSFENLDLEKLKIAAQLITKTSDFRAFCKQPDLYKHTVCHIKKAHFNIDNKDQKIVFIITANRFLRGMIRLLVGNILAVGYGKMSVKAFENTLKTGISPKFYRAAYPQGLYLAEVVYPFLNKKISSS